MKIKLVAVASFAILLFGIIYVLGFSEGGSLFNRPGNPTNEYSSLSQLEDSVDFEFQVPAIVGNGEVQSMKSYMNTMVEIVTDRLTFRAAEWIDYPVDLNGDYLEYDIDNEYESEDGRIWVRYKAIEGDNYASVNMKIDNTAYSIRFNSFRSESDAMTDLGINLASMKSVDRVIKDDSNESDGENESSSNEDMLTDAIGNINPSDYENTQEEERPQQDIDEDSTDINEQIPSDIDEQADDNSDNTDEQSEPSFTRYENINLKVSMMIPQVTSELTPVENENSIVFMMGGQSIFVIEYYPNGYSNLDFPGYSTIQLDDFHILRYVVNNTFDKSSQEYLDYYTIIENLDTLAMTFQTT